MPSINKEQLLTNFKELFLTEQKARDYYNGLLKLDIPKSDSLVIESIRNDEESHMQIVESILEILKVHKERNN